MGAKLRIAACFGALIVTMPTVAEAKPLERERYDIAITETFTDTECGDAITIDHTAHLTGLIMIKPGRAGDPNPYFFENFSGVETFTNVDNGLTATVTEKGLIKDLQIEQLEGTVIKVTAIETGRPIAVYGPDGKTLLFDAGRIRFTFYVDTLGDENPENDVTVGEDPPAVAGPHPVFVGEVDFCDLLDVLR